MVCDPGLLYLASEKIKSKSGNREIVPTTGLSPEIYLKLSESLKQESFDFQPGRRVQIQKPSHKGIKPLTKAPPRDKIVQEAMRIVLEAIFEPTFLESSHGFRPNKSYHTA